MVGMVMTMSLLFVDMTNFTNKKQTQSFIVSIIFDPSSYYKIRNLPVRPLAKSMTVILCFEMSLIVL